VWFKIEIVKQVEDAKTEMRSKDSIKGQDYRFMITSFFQASEDILHYNHKKLKKFVSNRLKITPSDKINYDFEYHDKETVELFKQGEYSTPVFRGEVNFPKHLRKEDLQIEDVNYKFGDFK